jgi:hypothetical protein
VFAPCAAIGRDFAHLRADRRASMLHTARAVRAIAIAVISVSCSSGDLSPVGVDAHVHHPDSKSVEDGAVLADGAPAPDAPAVTGSDAAIACKPANILHGDGKHNPGMDCMDSCHAHGFTVAGTLYLADGITPATDATVTVTDASGAAQDIVVSTNGNFFSFLPVQYPISVRASLCPSTQQMVGHAAAGGCNAVGCHDSGGVQGPAHL